MKAKILVACYLLLWAGVLASFIYFATQAQVPMWSTLIFAFFLFSIGNSSLVYFFRSRQLKQQGMPTPSYFKSVFMPKDIREEVALPRLVRVILGMIVLFGGLGFFGIVVLAGNTIHYTDSFNLLTKFSAILAMIIPGAILTFIGYRLMIMKNGEKLFVRKNQ